MYNPLGNVDLFTGGLAEDLVHEGVVGATFACIIEKQFKYLKEGDRFFFTNEGENGRSCTLLTVK